jgi:hypothetical protein
VGKKGKKGKLKKGGMRASTPRKPMYVPKLTLCLSTTKGDGHTKFNCNKYLADKKAGNVNKGLLFIYMLLMCTLLMLVVVHGYLIPIGFLLFVTLKNNNRITRV